VARHLAARATEIHGQNTASDSALTKLQLRLFRSDSPLTQLRASDKEEIAGNIGCEQSVSKYLCAFGRGNKQWIT